MGNINIIVGKCGEYSQPFKKTNKIAGINNVLYWRVL